MLSKARSIWCRLSTNRLTGAPPSNIWGLAIGAARQQLSLISSDETCISDINI
jgi:hypothetical protein